MALYHIFLVDPYRILFPNNAWADIKTQLNLLFDPIVGYAGGFEGALAVYSNGIVTPAPNELLVYVMPPGKSVVAVSPRGRKQNDPTADGTTNFMVGASEIYATNISKSVLKAKLAFHELMHNKLRLGQTTEHGPDALHTSQDGLGMETIDENTPLTKKNILTMAKALATPVPQWTAGIQIVLTGMHDPLSPFHSI
jgi:hypothetical protein